MATDKEIGQALIEAVAPQRRSAGREFADLGRIVAQGLSLGMADEIEAGVRAAATGKDFKEIRSEIMSGIEKKRKETPVGSFALEAIGSMPTGAMAAGRNLAQTAMRSAGIGGLYGYASAEPESEIYEDPLSKRRVGQAGAGAILSGISGTLADKLFPPTPTAAKELVKKGIPLTAGQAAGRGTFLNRMEDIVLNTIPVISDLAGNARVDATKRFNRVAVNEALAPLKTSVPKELKNIDDFAVWATKAIDDAYDDALKGVKLPSKEALTEVNKRVDDVIARYEGYEGFDFIKNSLEQAKKRAGRSIEDADQLIAIAKNLRKQGQSRLGSLDPKQQENGAAMVEAANSMIEGVLAFNPEKVPAYQSAQKAYGNFVPLRDAFARAVAADREFVTPREILREISKQDTTKGKRRLFKNQLPVQTLAQQAERTMGSSPLPSGSQTAMRQSPFSPTQLAGTGAATGGIGYGAVSDPLTTALTLGTLGSMYTFPNVGRFMTSKVISPALRGGLTAQGGAISERPLILGENLGLLD